MMFWLYIWPCS